MKIALISPFDKRTGISKYSYALCRALRQQNVHVSLIHQSDSASLLVTQENNFVKCYTTVEFIKNIRHYDIIHFQLGNSKFHHFQIHFLLLVYLFFRTKKIVTTIHDEDSNAAIDSGCYFCKVVRRCCTGRQNFFGLKKQTNIINRLFYQRSSYLIAHSSCMREFLQNFFDKKEKIETIKPISYLSDFRGKKSGAIEEYPVVTILIAGHIQPNKATDIVVEALAHINNKKVAFRAVFVGNIVDNHYHKHIQNLIINYGLADRVKIIGFAKERDFIKYFLDANIVVISRRDLVRESSGILIHALSAGAVVVAPDDGAFPEYIQDNRGLLYKRGNPLSLVNALQKLITSTKLRNEIAKNAKAYVQKELSDEMIAQKHIELYEKALGY